jgi:hypothetical protein
MKKQMTIYDAQDKANEHAKKTFSTIDFAFQGTDEDTEKQMDKVYQAIINAWADGWLTANDK